MRSRWGIAAAAAIMVAGLTSNASASIIGSSFFTGTGMNGTHNLSASVSFAVVGTDLKITLTNTSAYNFTTGNQMVPTDVLTALFFDVAPDQAFTQGTPFAVVGGTSSVVNGGSAPLGGWAGYDVTAPSPTLGGWRYSYDNDNNPLPQNQGLGTAGFAVFNGNEVNQGPGGPFNYGLIGSGYSPGEGNNAVDGTPFVQSSIVFTLSGLVGNISIANLRFQYGTALDEPFFTPIVIPGGGDTAVPEPTSLALAGFAGLGLVFSRLRKRRQAA
ncbi:MAG TPA: PEP-CTERM sorting domain-containing protein [Planctomycetaceae bacterium]|nr:PEP-CTERM sorting domain-containing protein [Planctomycetaceae bacterium]